MESGFYDIIIEDTIQRVIFQQYVFTATGTGSPLSGGENFRLAQYIALRYVSLDVSCKTWEVFMKHFEFKAYSVLNEIDLNKIAVSCGIPKKYTWEEPLILDHEFLGNILSRRYEADSKVLIFSFGSIVLVNVPEDIMPQLLGFIKKFVPETDTGRWDKYTDEYELRIEPESSLEITDEYAVVPCYEMFYIELAATVIAKSVAMERTEDELGKIFDQLESIIDRLEHGQLRVGDRELARTTAQVTRHQYNTISYIMILDEPDITWSNSDASLFYEKMSEIFELNDRYTILTKKADIMNNIISGFSSISHSIRGLFVEWVIVLLIVFEVILMVLDLII